MESLNIYFLIVGVLVVLNICIIIVAVKCAHTLPDDADLYDEDGNHIYYDRKLIRENKRRKIKDNL